MRKVAVTSLLAALFLVCTMEAATEGLTGIEPSSARTYYERAESRRFSEDWYGSIDDYLAALGRNPSYGEALVGLAECYYQLEEFDQALSYATKAGVFRKGDFALVDLEGFIRLGLDDLAGSRKNFETVLSALPNDLDGRFGLALLDLAGGKKTEARGRLEESLRISPQNARALLSLSLIALDQGRREESRSLVEKAIRYHSEDARVQLVAARLAASDGDRERAMFHAKNSIEIDPVRPDARRLLAILLYDGGDFEGVAALMREAISRDRKDATSWFTLGLAQFALGKTAEAIYSLSTASGLVPDDEVMRIALENLVMDSSAFEASQREPYAEWHIAKGFELEQRSYFDQSLIEYRRALRIYPYSVRGRTLYAELLRKRGLPAKQLSELRFLESIGKANRSTLDSIEIYASLLADGVGLSWGLDQYALTKRPYSVAIFIQPGQLEEYHTGGAGTLVRYLTDILASSSRLQVLPLDPRIGGPSEAFKRAREADADYYLTLTLRETDREIELGGELRVGRTGSVATTFRSYRTGNDRVKNTVVRLADSLVSSLQPEGSILKRSQDGALIDMGASDGLKAGDKLLVLKKGSLGVKNEGMGPSYAVSSIVGTLTVQQLDEEVCSGLLKSSGFFDTINSGDEVIAAPAEVASTSGGQSTAPAAKNPGGQPKPVSEPNFPGLFVSIRGLR